MPTTRKKVIKTVYKDEESEAEDGDFSDSGSDAKFSAEDESSSGGEADCVLSSGDEFDNKNNVKLSAKRTKKARAPGRKPKFAQTLLKKINKQSSAGDENDDEIPTSQFSVKDLTEADKLLPSFLNLSESGKFWQYLQIRQACLLETGSDRFGLVHNHKLWIIL